MDAIFQLAFWAAKLLRKQTKLTAKLRIDPLDADEDGRQRNRGAMRF